jgi:hypothetical protein
MLSIFDRSGFLLEVLTAGYLLGSRTIITTLGASTYTPPTNCKLVLFECIGSGAGGFNTVNSTAGQLISAGGGASGSYSATMVGILTGDTFDAFVGTGGGTSGGNGQQTSITGHKSQALLCAGVGGTPGTTITTGTAEAFGSGGGGNTGTFIGDLQATQNKALVGHRVTGAIGVNGRGAYGIFGGRPVGRVTQGNGAAGGNYGSGGSGGLSINAGGTTTGGTGGNGVIICWEFF